MSEESTQRFGWKCSECGAACSPDAKLCPKCHPEGVPVEIYPTWQQPPWWWMAPPWWPPWTVTSETSTSPAIGTWTVTTDSEVTP